MSFANGQTGIAFSRLWHLCDAKGQVLGHFCRGIASTLAGEHKPVYNPSNDCGDYVVVINARHITVSGNKRQTKIYKTHSGYPGGVTETPFWMMQQKTPERIIYNAVYGMLPKNKLRTRRVGRLLIFPDDKHPYAANITKFHEDPDLETISRRLWQNMTPEEFIKANEELQQKKLAEAIPEYFK
ncbi:hypothetical protein MP638_005514 [Amoeboaphelidium occidentale]|nr:hypothetical protein MP638_005514 [Amoeboaphelidium occidentale]